MKQMAWLTGVLIFVVGMGLLVRGYNLFSADVRSGEASWRIWTPEFWLARPGYPAMGLGNNGRWVIRIGGGVAALVAGWRLVRIAGRID